MSVNFPDHIVWIKEKFGEQLVETLGHEGLQLTEDQILLDMMEADPSQHKRAVDWLVRSYIAGGFLWEDVKDGSSSKAYHTLKLFSEFRANLPGAQRNLNDYKRLGSLYVAIQPFIPQPKASGKDEKRLKKSRAIEQSIVLHRDENLILAVPLSQESAQWWGMGTQWCTASTESENYFDAYNDKAPLIVALFPKGLKDGSRCSERKFQIWFEKNSLQFMDETDTAVDPEFVKQYWPDFSPLIQGLLLNGVSVLRYIPEDLRVHDICALAFKNSCLEIAYMPKNSVTREMVLEALVFEPGMLLDFKEMIDKEFALKVLDICPATLMQILPEKLKVKDFFVEAIKKSSDIIYYVPESLLTPDICKLFVQLNPDCTHKLPTNLITREIIDISLAKNPENIRKFMKIIDEDHLMEWIEKDVRIAQDIPLSSWTKNIINLILDKHPEYLKVIPSKFINKKMCADAFKKNKIAATGIPDRFHTKATLSSAIANGRPLRTLSPNLMEWLDEKDILNAIDQSVENLWFMDESFFNNQDISLAALDKEPEIIGKIPEKYLTQELCKQIVIKRAWCLHYIPKNFVNRELCAIASEQFVFLAQNETSEIFTADDIALFKLKQNGRNLEFVPIALRTKPVCLTAVGSNGQSLAYVPENILDEEIIITAIQNNLSSFHCIPKKYHTLNIQKAYIKRSPESINWFLSNYKSVNDELVLLALQTVWEKSGKSSAIVLAGDIYSHILQKDLIDKIRKKLEDFDFSVVPWDRSILDKFSDQENTLFSNLDQGLTLK